MFNDATLDGLIAAREELGICRLDWDIARTRAEIGKAQNDWLEAQAELMRLNARRNQIDPSDAITSHELEQRIPICENRQRECTNAVNAAQAVLTMLEKIRELELNAHPREVTKGHRAIGGVMERWTGERNDPDSWL